MDVSLEFEKEMTTKIRQSPKMPAAQRRQQLLRSAQRLFVKKGFLATTMEEIARGASLTKGALYYHFENKEHVFLELLKSIAERNETAFAARLKGRVSPAEFLRLLLDLHCECDACEYGEMMDIWVQAWRIPRTRRYITRRLKTVHQRLGGHIDPAYVSDKKSLPSLTMFIIALVHGLSGLRMLVPGVVDLDEQVKLFESLTAVKGRAGRRRSNR